VGKGSPPPVTPIGVTSSPLKGEEKAEKDFGVPTCRSFAAAASSLEGEAERGSFLFISP